MQQQHDEQAEGQRNMDEQPTLQHELACPLVVEVVLELGQLANLGEHTSLSVVEIPIHRRDLALQFANRARPAQQVIGEIARRARGTPRVAGRLLRRVRDFAAVAGKTRIDAATADAALTRLEVDPRGLDAMDRRYLSCIAQNYGGGPVGVETLAAALSEERDTIEDVIEPYLIQQGFLQRGPRGRLRTDNAFHHIGLDVPVSRQGQLGLDQDRTDDDR